MCSPRACSRSHSSALIHTMLPPQILAFRSLIHSISYFGVKGKVNWGCLCRWSVCLISSFQGLFWLLRHLLAMLSKQRGFLHLAESFRCRGFCLMSEGSAINAFLKGSVYEIQCRPLLKLSQPYFPRFRWPLDPGSPSPTWQSYIMSDFFLHHDCFFP